MSQEIKIKIDVFATPDKITQGQMFSIQAVIYDTITGAPMLFDKIYMQILDEKGTEIWPVSTVAEGAERIDKLISTSEMDPGKYLVRVSPSRKMRPMGAAQFEIDSTLSPVVPLIPPILLAITSSSTKEKIEKEFLGPKNPPKINWLIYQTEKDSRVCPVCLPHDGKVFRPDDPSLIRIGPEQLGGDTHYRCRCHYDFITEEMERRQMDAAFEEELRELEEIYEIYQVSMVGQKAFNQLKPQ